MNDYTAFVPAGEDRRATARLLVETADEHGISQRAIRSVNRGFDITEELADVLFEEGAAEDQTDLDPDGDPVEETEPDSEPTEDEVPKSVPATQTEAQSRTGKGDSTADKPATKKTSGNRAAKNTNSEEE